MNQNPTLLVSLTSWIQWLHSHDELVKVWHCCICLLQHFPCFCVVMVNIAKWGNIFEIVNEISRGTVKLRGGRSIAKWHLEGVSCHWCRYITFIICSI